jgi:hypothetical protein
MAGYSPCLVSSDTFVNWHSLAWDFTRRHAFLFIRNDREIFCFLIFAKSSFVVFCICCCKLFNPHICWTTATTRTQLTSPLNHVKIKTFQRYRPPPTFQPRISPVTRCDTPGKSQLVKPYNHITTASLGDCGRSKLGIVSHGNIPSMPLEDRQNISNILIRFTTFTFIARRLQPLVLAQWVINITDSSVSWFLPGTKRKYF